MDAPTSMEERPPESFDALARRHRTGVWRYLRALGCAPDAADDLTQEALLAAFRSNLRERGPGTSAWLRRAARHCWLRSVRANARRREVQVADAVDAIWEPAAADDGGPILEALRQCLGELGERSGEVVRLRYGEGMTREELAAQMGLTANGVKTLLHRTRQVLRDCMERRMS